MSNAPFLQPIMDNHNYNTLKRRRPFGHGHDGFSPMLQVERVFQDSIPSFPHGIEASALSTDGRRYILEQAASILSVSLPQLLELSRPREQTPSIVEQAADALAVPVSSLLEFSQQHGQKRPRLNTNVQQHMPPPLFCGSPVAAPVSSASQEKSPESRYPGPGAHFGGHPEARRNPPAVSEAGSSSFLGLGGARIADCLSNFSVCNPCSPYDSPPLEYQPLATTAPYEYGTNRVVDVTHVETAPGPGPGPDPGHPPIPASLSQAPEPEFHVAVTTNVELPGLLGSEGPVLLGGYVQQYPAPMRPSPSRVTGFQPPTTRETMFYPVCATSAPYVRPVPTSSHMPGAQLPPEPHVMEQAGGYVGNQMPMATLPAPNPHHDHTDRAGPHIQHGHPGAVGGGEMVSMQRYAMVAGYGGETGALVGGDGRVMSMEEFARTADLEMVFPAHRAPPAKRGPFKDHSERQKTAYTRKIGSCIRCRMQRIRCHTDPDDDRGPCGTCKKVANANKIHRLPCLRLKISDVILSKPGQVKGHEWTRRWKDSMVTDDISSWASSDIRTIRVTEGFTGNWVELRVREFVPQEGDSLERSWVHGGVKRSVRIPAYALVDMDAAKDAYRAYIKSTIIDCCKHILFEREEVLWRSYALAIKMSMDPAVERRDRQLLTSTLELWMSIRLTTTSFWIVGEEMLGMPRDIMDETSPLKGQVPLPPVMGAQLDSILIHQIQSKFRHDTLDLLQKLTQENKPKTWLTTYLVTFILLHNIALVIKHDASYARKHGMRRRFAREEKVKEYFIGAVTLLAYFHYRGGSKIFATEFKEDDLRLHCGDDAVQFVGYTRKFAEDHKRLWQDLVQGPGVEDEFYFVAQMYEQNWLPRSFPD